MWGSVMKISIKIIPRNRIKKITKLVAFLRTSLVGGLNIRQSRAPGLLNIRVTSLEKSWFLISSTRSIGINPFLSLIVFEAPLNKISLTERVFSLMSTFLTARCNGVSPSPSYLLRSGPQASKYPKAISDWRKQAQCSGVEPRLSAEFMSRPNSLKKYKEEAESPYAATCSIFKPVAVRASLSAPFLIKVFIASRWPL